MPLPLPVGMDCNAFDVAYCDSHAIDLHLALNQGCMPDDGVAVDGVHADAPGRMIGICIREVTIERGIQQLTDRRSG